MKIKLTPASAIIIWFQPPHFKHYIFSLILVLLSSVYMGMQVISKLKFQHELTVITHKIKNELIVNLDKLHKTRQKLPIAQLSEAYMNQQIPRINAKFEQNLSFYPNMQLLSSEWSSMPISTMFVSLRASYSDFYIWLNNLPTSIPTLKFNTLRLEKDKKDQLILITAKFNYLQ